MTPDRIPLEKVSRALVVKLRHHGDVLLASPVLAVLKQHAPAVEIDALVYAETAPMLALHPALAMLHTVDRKWKRQGTAARIAREWALYRRLAARRYDLLIHLSESWRGAWLARTAGVRWSVAPRRRDSGYGWQASFTHLVPEARNRHVVETNLDALRRIGIQPAAGERELVFEPGEEARGAVKELMTKHRLESQRFVHIHPTSRWLFKCWHAAGWADLIHRLQAAAWPVVLTAAPDAAEHAAISAIRKKLRHAIADFSGQLTLKQLGALAAQARLFIGVDSAPMHIAAAMRTPVVALFGPSGETMWGPWGRPRMGVHRVVSSERHPCRPCGLDGCGGGKVSDCLETLEIEPVWRAAQAQLALTTD